MKAITIFSLLCILLGATSWSRTRPIAEQQSNAEIALLTQPKGTVKLNRARHTGNVTDDSLLNAGDVLTMGGNGEAVIYQAYLPVKRLGKNESFTVEILSPPPQGSALTLEEFGSFKRNYLAAHRNRGRPSPTTQGGSEDANLAILEPRNSYILDGKPLFVWTRVSDATKYVVNIYDDKESVICSQTSTEPRLPYPANCSELKPGSYKFDVTAQIGDQVSGDPALYDATSFVRPDDKQTKEIVESLQHARTIAEADKAARSIYAATLFEHHLFPQAELELLHSLRDNPADQALWTLLIETYYQMKRWPAREKAKTISLAPNLKSEMVWTLNKREP
jgi:hypothetical protein